MSPQFPRSPLSIMLAAGVWLVPLVPRAIAQSSPTPSALTEPAASLANTQERSLTEAPIPDPAHSEPTRREQAQSLPAAEALPAPLAALNPPPLPPLPGPRAYIPQVPMRLVLRLGERQVHVWKGDRHIASYPVAIGRDGWETPTGQFEVLQMISNPSWEHPFTRQVIPPGEDNPLGVRWIGFWTDGNNFIGFHGTPNPNLIGQAVSHGCVRMRNTDIVELFEQVDLGTHVTVEP